MVDAERSRNYHKVPMIGHDPIMATPYRSAGSEMGGYKNQNPKGNKKSALITPPKEDKALAAAASTSPNSRSDAPFSPIRTTYECGDDFEPLPYKVNIFEGSLCSPNAWQRVYSPIQATPNNVSPAKGYERENQVSDKLRSLINVSENLHGVDEEKPQLPNDEVKADKKPSAYHPHNQWPTYPPPMPYWYHQQYHYGYHHHHYDQPKNGRLSYPTLQPNPQTGHAYRPSVPFGHFGSVAQIPFHQEYIANVTHNDVVCGRGGAVNNHPGNLRFRRFIQEFKHQYMTESKQVKPYIAVRVIEAVKNSDPPGRFLVKYPGGYLECSEDRAREKAKQALREAAAKIRKEGFDVEGGAVESSNDANDADDADDADDAIEQRGLKRILLPNERSFNAIEYHDEPEYSDIFEPPYKKKDDDSEHPCKNINVEEQMTKEAV